MYVPIEICGSFLEQTAARLDRLFPEVETRPVIADFGEQFVLPAAVFYGTARTAAGSNRTSRSEGGCSRSGHRRCSSA